VSREIIAKFWEAMGSNDFTRASLCLHPQYQYYMPQTREYLSGRAEFAALNDAFPANGNWTFDVQTIVADGDPAVSDVLITDGKMTARAITFHTLQEGLILRQKEYWPDDYAAPMWRKALMTPVDVAPF